VITHLRYPTFIDRAAGKSLVATKAAATKKHSDDDEKCCRNGLRLIAMAREMFDGSTPETRIDALLGPGVNPLEGSPNVVCGSWDRRARSRLPTLKRGRGSSWEPRD
jgi:hypothetical protein